MNKLLIQGQIPYEERDLGTPPKIFRSDRKWAFTYSEIKVPSELSFSAEEKPNVDLLLKPHEKGILVEANPSETGSLGTKVFVKNIGGELMPGKSYVIPTGSVLVFSTRVKNGRIVELQLTKVSDHLQKEFLSTPSEELVDENVFAKFVQMPDGARELAKRGDLPEIVFERLVCCPDPLTRYNLIVNPSIPFATLPWACGYPDQLKKNPQLLFIFSNPIVRQHFSTFPPGKADEIRRRLFGLSQRHPSLCLVQRYAKLNHFLRARDFLTGSSEVDPRATAVVSESSGRAAPRVKGKPLDRMAGCTTWMKLSKRMEGAFLRSHFSTLATSSWLLTVMARAALKKFCWSRSTSDALMGVMSES